MDVSGKNVVLALLLFGTVLATVAYFGKPIVRLRPQTPIVKPMLVVLPFENLNGDDELELIAANVTVALTEALASVEAYELVPRETALQHKGLEDGIEAIAASLGADYALAGSVEREEGRLRLQVYVVKPGERPRIWADEYYYDAGDEADIPADLVRHIRGALAGN